MITTIFFDLDGTLIDQKHAQDIAILSLYKKYGFDLVCNIKVFSNAWDKLTEFYYDAYLRREITYEEQRLLRIVNLFSNFKIAIPTNITPLSIYEEYLCVFENNWTVFNDVIPTLSSITNYKLAIISNGEIKQQIKKLEKTGINKFFNDIVVASDYFYAKPHSALFRIACERQHIKYEQCCYVGDNYSTDMVPCKNLGIRGIYINRKKEPIIDPQISIIETLTEIPVILKELNKKKRLR